MDDKKVNKQFTSTKSRHSIAYYIDRNCFTIEELLFLYLLEYNNLQNNYIVPEFITQQGIKNSLDCDLSFISRLLKKNEEEGLIFRKLIKVENKKRKQNAFFLTHEGIEHAFILTKSISN